VITISAVIPTYNRYESLLRTLRSLSLQTALPEEVIIVDASDGDGSEDELRNSYPSLHIKYIRSKPSVCAQRNIGIQIASGSHVFLCDDDIEFSNDYVLRIKKYIDGNAEAKAVSGSVLEKNKDGGWGYDYPVVSIWQLFWKFIFQQSLWCDIKRIRGALVSGFSYHFLVRFYVHRKNTFSLAGWPLVTNFEGPVFKTAFYGLGASIIKTEWLRSSPFDEVLDAHGIGDNYGVALHFPDFPAIHVLTDVHAYHHKIDANRLSEAESFFKRGLALHYFMTGSERFTAVNRLFLVWSLIGNWLVYCVKGNRPHLRAVTKLISAILAGRNPYVVKSGRKKSGGR